jgi:hypothetical protein
VMIEGWDIDDALTEMKNGGYGFHEVWSHLEPWIRNLDLKDIAARAGLEI